MGNPLRVGCCSALIVLLCLAGTVMPLEADSRPGDQDTERYLLKAQVTRIHMVMDATTYPMTVDLERKKDVRRAAFKYGQSVGPPIDDYRHEVAAYRLDRALDLKMVPVAVLRDVKTSGALIEWISPALTEEDLEERGELAAATPRLEEQRAVMNIFDALVCNEDRKVSDQLISPGSWDLHLIDHSRAFQVSTDLPEAFMSQTVRLPRSLERRLENLKEKPLTILFDDLLTREQIRALLQRRDRILTKLEEDRERLGDAAIYLD